jgi:four helix bundle protein
MTSIKKFEDIQAWQKAREFTKLIYSETGKGPFAKDYPLNDQTKRAAISIMLNIAEGFGRKTDKELKQYLVQAHGSCAEVQAALL